MQACQAAPLAARPGPQNSGWGAAFQFSAPRARQTSGATVNLAQFLRTHPERDRVRQGRGPRPALTWACASFPNCHPAEGEIFVPLIPQFVVTSEVISRLFLCSRSTSSYGNTLQGLKWPLLWVGEGWRILVGLADCVIRASPAWGDVTTQQTPPSLGRGGQVGPPLTGAASPGKRGRRASWWSGACALPPWAGWGP